MIKAFIFGATGYAGAELIRILGGHPEVSIEGLSSRNNAGDKFSDIYPGFRHLGALECCGADIDEAADRADIVFLSMPHGVAGRMLNNSILRRTKVIDLGPDFRLNDPGVYEKWYEVKPPDTDILSMAVYGLSEIYRDRIKNSQLIANPGCYTTCAILALYPLLKEGAICTEGIVIDAKSGVSGAGRGLTQNSLFCECNESIKAYKVASHRHTPEIEEKLGEGAGGSITLVFTPHLTPMNRGILSTAYVRPKSGVTNTDIMDIYKKYYDDEFFIRLTKYGALPETRWVRGSNFCDIGFVRDERTGTLVLISALDNLVKGAAGQAVQNMNLMFGFPVKTGLEQLPIFI